MIGNSAAQVSMNFNQLFLKLNQFICNLLPVLPDHWSFIHQQQWCETRNASTPKTPTTKRHKPQPKQQLSFLH